MKQTNNAIKFLMAQYRAIFRNANLKMFLAAATAAAALAAGQSQAATTVANWKDLATGDYNNQAAQGTDKKIAIVGSDGNNVNTTGFDVVIVSGDATIKGAAGHQEFTVNTADPDALSKITLLGNDASSLTIGGAGAGENVTVSIDAFVAQQGKLVLTGSGADAGQTTILNAKDISVGGEAAKKGVIEIGKFSSLGGDDTQKSIKVLSGGELKFTDATSVAKAANGVLLSGGKITLGVGAASSGTIVNGLVAESGVLTLGEASNAGKLIIETGSAHFKGENSFDSVSGDSNLTVNGDVIFEKGSIKANKGSVSFGTLQKGESQTLTIDAADWTKFFEGKGISFTGTDATSVVKIDVKNATDTSAIDLATVVKASDGTFAIDAGNKITVTTAGKAEIYADNAKFTAGEKLAEGSGSFNFQNLTVGKDGAFSIEAGSVNVGNKLTVTAHTDGNANLTVSKAGVLTLDAKGDPKTASGTVTAKVLEVNATALANEALNIKNGKWSTTGELKITQGTVNVQNAELALGGKLTVAATNGKLKADASVVDATKGDFDLKANTVELGNTSTLVLNADKVFSIDNGTKELSVKTEFTKNAASSAANSKISLKPSSGTSIELTKEQYQKLLEGTGFNGVFSGINVTGIESKPGEMEIGGADGIVAGLDGKYDQNVGKTDSAISGGTYDMGAVKVSGESLSLGTGGNLTLVNAGANGGNFVSGTKDGKTVVGSVSLDDANGNGLTLGGAGNVGAITTATEGKGSVTFGEAKTENAEANIGNVNVLGSIGSDGTTPKALGVVVVNGSSVDVQAGDVYTQNIKINGGSLSLDEGKTLQLGNGAADGLNSSINGDITADLLTVKTGTTGSLNIAGDAKLDIGTLKGAAGVAINVGQDGVKNGSASVVADTLVLNDGGLFIDPDYDQTKASAVVMNLSGAATNTNAGTLDGKVAIGKNAAFGVGFNSLEEMDEVIAGYLTDGHFTQDTTNGGVHNALVLNKRITLDSGKGGIMVGENASISGTTAQKVEFGANSALVITDNVFDNNGGVKSGTAISGANTVTVGNGVELVLVGDFNAKDDNLDIFGTATPTGTMQVMSLNGLLVGEWKGGKLDLNLTEDEEILSKAFIDSAAPIRELLLDSKKGELGSGDGLGRDLINKISSVSLSGAVVDAAAHAATYAGAQQAAVAAVGTMAEAVGGRVGSMGVEAATISATGSQANGGVWLSPMYKSVDADGFDAQGASYGADVDLAGVAFGADTVNGNMRFGAVFNIGSGDADGKGNGNGLKDEFDYYGFGMYSVMGFGNFALVGDASLNVISHDVEGLGFKGEADTTAVTMGVTGQYTISNPAVDVTPHIGARFIRLDTDSYDLVADGETSATATTDFDVQNVFSVPLGVTLSKAFEMGGWSLAPSADLSITFNTGDTEVESTTRFSGVNRNIGLTTEVLDEVTYGVAVGLGAQYGAFGTNIGINYTGSSNTDAFGVNANARYMF